MRRWGWTVSLLMACSTATAPAPEPPAEPSSPPNDPPPKADDPTPSPADALTPDVGIACDRANTRTCVGDQPLRCVVGSGGGKWMPEPPCAQGLRCVPDWGCLPLPPCFDAGQLNCVDQRLYVCEAEAELIWRHATDCPAAIPCIDGRGCPNPYGIGTDCSFTDPPRCAGDRVMHCTLAGIDSIWGAPTDCPDGSRCRPGQGCEDDDTRRRPTRSPLPE